MIMTIDQQKTKGSTIQDIPEKNSKNVPRKKKRNAREFWRAHNRSISKVITFQSELVHRYASRLTNSAHFSSVRLSTLMFLTSDSDELRTRLSTWYDAVKKVCEIDIANHAVQRQIFKDAIICDIPKSRFRKPLTYRIEVTHPCCWPLISLLMAIDEEVADYELYWLMNEMSEYEFKSVAKAYIGAFDTLIKRIDKMTFDSRDRIGGIYSVEKYNALLSELEAKINGDK